MSSLSQNAPPPAFKPHGRILRSEDVQSLRDGRRFVEEARAYAEKLREQAAAAFEEERRRGFAEGQEAARTEGASLLAEASARIDRHLSGLDQALATLVIDTIERILGACDHRELSLRAIRHALDEARTDEALTLYVQPDMVEQLRRRLADPVHGLAPDGPQVKVEPDPQLSNDACVMSTRRGFVELTIDAQIQALRKGIAMAMDGATGP
ncbi:MAG TPA: type III secretion system stator protein SctL [Alphaproteobacteria bacterium]|nr:type III secretion system stator protein SctL [Alphaproteobacteria bacterium]